MDWDNDRNIRVRKQCRTLIGIAVLVIGLALVPKSARADQMGQVDRLFLRIAGVPLKLDDPRRQQMLTLIQHNDYIGAAAIAADDDNFYNVTLKHWAAPLSNRDETTLVPMSDFIAMIIGTVRDGRDFREILWADFTYVADPALVPSAPMPSATDNNHYQFLDNNFVNLRQTLLRVTPQRADITDAAGVLTSRQWGMNHLIAGTNRRPIEFAFQEFACTYLKDMVDTSIPDYHVRRDVDRSPGGNATTYETSCRDCHAGMDALAGAYAHFDFPNNSVTFNPTQIAQKMNKNNTVYPAGFVTTDDSWTNHWNQNQNAALGWRYVGNTGHGVSQFGEMLSYSSAFSSCMATRVFTQMCRRAPNPDEAAGVAALAAQFEATNYSMKYLFEAAATLPNCLGD